MPLTREISLEKRQNIGFDPADRRNDVSSTEGNEERLRGAADDSIAEDSDDDFEDADDIDEEDEVEDDNP